ncbi:MAG TPA: PEGA domain-containing protein [Terriglobales bacterium]|nr:PEGA domain-containing protein [Terriglobales bacterium]
MAVTEIKKTPRRFFMASTAAAIAAILLIVGAIAWHTHSEISDEDGTPAQPAASASAQPSGSANPSAAQAPAANQTPEQVAPELVTAEPRTVSVQPKYNEERPMPKERVKPRPAPAIIPGQLSVRSTAPGAQGPRTIKGASGSKSSMSVQLAPLAATVSVNSDPPDAALWMDGKDTGRMTPAQISVDQPGTHTFVFKKQGYLEETTVANLRIGQTFHLAPSLRALGRTDEIKMVGKFRKLFRGSEMAGMGTVSVKTRPKGAQIAVNAWTLDKPSPAEFYLNPGNYVIDITASGFKIIHRVVSVNKGGKVAIDEVMDHE